MEVAFWNFERCEARKVRLVVADNPAAPRYWARGLVGQERDAVEVRYGGDTFYLDDEPFERGVEEVAFIKATLGEDAPPPATGFPGWGWEKVTEGRGSPRYGHRNLRPAPGSVRDR